MSKYTIAVVSDPTNFRKIREEIAMILANKSDPEFEEFLVQLDKKLNNTIEIPKIKILSLNNKKDI